VTRSTFIVGFPGETQADFEALLDVLRAARLDHVGCFAYSPVAGAAANALPGQLPKALREERLQRFMAIQAGISREKLAERIGQRLTILVDEVEDEQVITRSYRDAPEIDGKVMVPGARDLEPGDFIEVTGAQDHDLWARPVED
jgi:ribosomal protein S12 methylthiotransferase